MSGHTKEPWQEAIEIGFNADTAGARTFPNWKVAEMIASARTATLAGLDPAALPALIEAAEGAEVALIEAANILEGRGLRGMGNILREVATKNRTALANLHGDAALTDGEVGK